MNQVSLILIISLIQAFICNQSHGHPSPSPEQREVILEKVKKIKDQTSLKKTVYEIENGDGSIKLSQYHDKDGILKKSVYIKKQNSTSIEASVYYYVSGEIFHVYLKETKTRKPYYEPFEGKDRPVTFHQECSFYCGMPVLPYEAYDQYKDSDGVEVIGNKQLLGSMLHFRSFASLFPLISSKKTIATHSQL